MLSPSQLCATVARLTASDHSHVDQVATYLRKEGRFPSYPEGHRGRPAKDEQIRTTAEHAAALIVALMVTDRPAATPAALKLAEECLFQNAIDTVDVTTRTGVAGSSAFSLNEPATASMAWHYGSLPAATMLGSLIIAEQAGRLGKLEVIAVSFMLEPEASFFTFEVKDLSDPTNPDGRRLSYWFCRLGSDMAAQLRGGIPRFTVAIPGKLIHDIGQALGPLSLEDTERYQQNEDNWRAAVVAAREATAQPEAGAA
jgi:hypothetical protein